jgi:xylan 1,4-beta-xylosidase
MQSSRVLPFLWLSTIAGACGGGGGKGMGGAAGFGGAGGGGNAPGVACGDSAPWTTSGTPGVTLTVDAAATGMPWSRFYEGAVATDHANTLLSSAYGRNAQASLKKGHDQAGFRYARFHGILNRDIGVYPATAPAVATDTPAYDWTRFDQVYDAVVAAGMRPIVEIGFTPPGLASNATQLQSQLWYGGASPNISKPILPPTAGATATWDHWHKFMADIVHHLEDRYGAAEVRNNWYFEVWNEATWMYGPGAAGYNELYYNTALGLLAGDPQVKVGGPADSGGNSPNAIPSLINFVKTQPDIKLDFVSYHHYGKDSGPNSDAGGFVNFKRTLLTTIAGLGFTGELINDEWGPGYDPELSRDTEASASFIAKAVHFIGTDTTTRLPTMYGYWTMSDIYEEMNTGAARAYREGNYGLTLKGDPNVPVSFDLAKPAFNGFRLLHLMTDTTVPVAGGITDATQSPNLDGTTDATHPPGVGAVATLSADGNSLQILVYNHVNNFDNATWEAMAQQSTLVSLAVSNLPFAPTRVLHYIVDHTHSNSHTVWAAMGKPIMPTADQWQALSDASELCYYAAVVHGGSSWTAMFPQYTYSASLIELRRD